MRVLVLGGTGAMGTHVCRILSAAGNEVTSTSRRPREDGGVAFVIGDAKKRDFLDPLLAQGWDAIVDFMVWSTKEFSARVDELLAHANQYIFVSSYRVYADSPVIKENSPRLLDTVDDADYLATDEYALAKARCEDMLVGSGLSNWTVVRPAITYDGSVGRLQLGVMESGEWLCRATRSVPIPFPKPMLEKQATMTWAGDVARMIARLVGNPVALGESYTVSTSDHMCWADVVEAYRDVVPFEVVPCDLDEFIRMRGGRYQVLYDRLFDRVVDNSKVLAACGMERLELTTMREGLARELRVFLQRGQSLCMHAGSCGKLDRLVGGMPSLLQLLKEVRWYDTPSALAKYSVRRLGL